MPLNVNGEKLITKTDITLSTDLLKNVKWSKITYANGKPQSKDDRLGTQLIPIDEKSPVVVDFEPSNEQINWDIIGFGNVDNNTWNTDDSWQSENKIWYADWDWRNNTARTGIKYIAFVLNNVGKADKVTCTLRATQQVNVVDYIKNNFDNLLTIQDFVPRDINLLDDVSPINRTYDQDGNKALKIDAHGARVLWFPISVSNISEIKVSFTPINANAGMKWGYFFTTVNKAGVANTVLQLSDWTTTSQVLTVPQNAKYVGFCVGSDGTTLPTNQIDNFAILKAIVHISRIDYLKSKF